MVRSLVFAALTLLAASSARAQDDQEPVLGVSTGDADEGLADEAAQDDVVVAGAAEVAGAADAEEEEIVDPDDAGADADADVDAPAPAPPARWTDERALAWSTVAASFAVAVLGGVLLAVGVDDVNTIESAPDGTLWDDVSAARERAPIFTGIGAAVLALGTLGTAVGAALLAHYGEGGTWVTLSASPSGLAVRGRF